MSAKLEAKRQRQCGRKFRHRTAVEAGKHAEHLHRNTGIWANVYACRWCGGFHVGGGH